MKSSPSIYIIAGKNVLAGRGGYAVVGYNWGKLLSSLGYEVKIYCVGAKDQITKSQIGEVHIVGSKIATTFLKDVEMAGLLFLAPKIALAILRDIKDQKIVILGMGPWSLAGALLKIYSTVIPAKAGIHKIILLSDYYTSIKHEYSGILSGVRISDHGVLIKLQIQLIYYFIFKLYSLLERFLLRITDKIITHYLSTENILKDEFKISPKKFIRLPYHTHVIARSPKATVAISLKPKLPLILLICRHDGRKGINFLLHAFHILNKRGVKYSALIAGAGPLLKKHQQLAKKLGLDNVKIPGFIADTRPFLKKAALFVFPSLEEGSSSLAILEAMQQGMSIVSTNVDGIPEDLIHNKSAILVPPKDPEALADGMEKLLSDPKLAKKLGRQAKIRYYQKYNLLKVKREVRNFLNGL
ncbi:glycosyltransferase family 4 protein [Candidatus Microgenomates bacterium]|nr:glycosyltransferase family 4 protein [Candidatus Microgenomates bacterium]